MEDATGEQDKDNGDKVAPRGRMSFEEFMKERARMVDARQRSQQRTDYLLTAGAAGALVLSITFLEKIAPSPDPATGPILYCSWLFLLLALGLNLGSHFAAKFAFDDAIRAFDESYRTGIRKEPKGTATKLTDRLSYTGAASFVIGVALMAVFATLNVTFAGEVDVDSFTDVEGHV